MGCRRSQFRQLPRKQPGRHRWIYTMSWFVTDEQAEAMHSNGSYARLDGSNLTGSALICWDCKKPWESAAGHPCRPTRRLFRRI